MRAGSRSRRHWFGSSLEGRIKMISNSDHAFESGHATPLEAHTHFGRNARQRRNSDVTNLVIVGRSAAGSRLLASRFYGYLAAMRRAWSNVGTPTAVVALPYSLDRKMLFFEAFTGAGLLRSDPPDRYVFNYRASYAEETAAVVNYLVKVKRLLPEQIAVFAQQDTYGGAGFAGVEKAIRSLREAMRAQSCGSITSVIP